MLIRCKRELILGKWFAKLLNLFWRRLNDFLCPFSDFWVSIAMLIWSLIKLCELKVKTIEQVHWIVGKTVAYLEMCWFSLTYISRRFNAVPLALLLFISPDPLRSSSLSTWIWWFCVILLNSVRYECKISLCLVKVWIIAAPETGRLVIFSFISLSLLNMSSISIEIVSKLNSLEISGLDSPLDMDPELILLSATSFKSISFSTFLARFRISANCHQQKNKRKSLMISSFVVWALKCLTVPRKSLHSC